VATPKKPALQIDLVPRGHSDVVVINGRCEIHEEEDLCIAVVSGIPVFRYHREDVVERSLFIAQALALGFATPRELSRALGVSESTVFRYQRLYRAGGATALIPKKPGSPEGQHLEAAEQTAIRTWHEAGVSGREIARRLKKAPGVVQKALRRMGLPPRRPRARQQALPGTPSADTEDDPAPSVAATSADASPVPVRAPAPSSALVFGRDPFDRSLDRLLAAEGLLHDAQPVFADGSDIPRLGALLAIPLLVTSGLFSEASRIYGSIGPAFYGLRTSLLVLAFMALLRIKHPENLKEYSPPLLGRIIGLDRAPEVKTLRRKLKRLSAGHSETLLRALAERRVAAREEAMGFLYVDGHVRVYSGEHRLPKAHVARMRISLPAMQEMWVNDAAGDPVFFVTQEAHPQLVSALPPILEEVREMVGHGRRITVVFDRGGWSPRLFKQMEATGFDVITYRKGKTERIPEDHFTEYDAPGTDGRRPWLLHERSLRVGGAKDGLWMRQVTRRKGDHQTHIVTTRQDLGLVEVAQRMFARWQQENFLKYMRQEFAIDALLEYGFEEEDQLRDTPNPAWTRADKAWKKARRAASKLKVTYAELTLAGKERPPELLGAVQEAQRTVAEAKAARDELPPRITIGEFTDDERTVRLPARRKRLSDGLKMLAYQVESDLVRAIAPHYARADDEGRTLIASAFQSAGDLEVTPTELRVTLNPQSSPHRTHAIAELCRQLDETETCFPGTDLRIRYAIRGPTVTLAKG
jgi:transposase